jgi:Na+-driven multidrug efflux pump
MTLTSTIEPPRANLRTQLLLKGPIVSTLFRLSWPNILVMLAQTSTGLIEIWWISHLGTDALAGMAVVFPAVMLMQMMSQGAMGGGTSSAIARALAPADAARQTPLFSMPSSSTSSSARSSRSPFSCSDLLSIVP